MKLSALFLIISGGADAANSRGCGNKAPVSLGSSAMSGSVSGASRTWRIYVPKSYSETKAVPLVVSTHGWGGDGRQEERATGLNAMADKEGFIVVYPDGMADNSNRGGWGSWNVVGSTQSPGPSGKTCNVNLPSYCYNSCNGCGSGLGCDWTTCQNDITPSGIGKNNVNGFLPSLYDYIEDSFCIDTAREYHTGMSNGAMATFQMGVSAGTRLAGIVPVAGSMHRGFADNPSGCVPIMNLVGTRDRNVPPGPTELSSDGWYYTPSDTILSGWTKSCSGCSSSSKRTYKTPYDGNTGLQCTSYGCDSIVECKWSGGHTWPSYNGQLVMFFLNQHSNAEHLGGGLTKNMDPKTYTRAPRIRNAQALPAHTSITTEDKFHGMPLDDLAVNTTARSHYGNPAKKCRADEDVLSLPGGAVCAPRITHKFENVEGEKRPKPACSLGGQTYNSQSGCPNDTPGAQRGNVLAFPTCLGLDESSFHCVLTCGPCREAEGEDCTIEAHDACPGQAQCVTGLNKQVHFGTCMYPSKLDANLGNSTVGVVEA